MFPDIAASEKRFEQTLLAEWRTAAESERKANESKIHDITKETWQLIWYIIIDPQTREEKFIRANKK